MSDSIDVAGMIARHRSSFASASDKGPVNVCIECDQDWPCDFIEMARLAKKGFEALAYWHIDDNVSSNPFYSREN